MFVDIYVCKYEYKYAHNMNLSLYECYSYVCMSIPEVSLIEKIGDDDDATMETAVIHPTSPIYMYEYMYV